MDEITVQLDKRFIEAAVAAGAMRENENGDHILLDGWEEKIPGVLDALPDEVAFNVLFALYGENTEKAEELAAIENFYNTFGKA